MWRKHYLDAQSPSEVIFLENVWRQHIVGLCRMRVAPVLWRLLPVELICHILRMAYPLDVVRAPW